jgi:hypothetical protein
MNDMTADEGQRGDHAETLSLINTEVTAYLTQQADGSAKLETKAVTLVGYAGALSAFLATRHAQSVLAALAYIAYAIAAGLGIVAFMWGPELRMVAAPRALFTDYWEQSKGRTLAALAATRVKAFEANGPKLLRKARYTQLSLIFLVIGVPLMGASIIVVARHHT